MIAWAFPGQGSQRPGMGRGLSCFPQLAQAAQAATGTDVAGQCLKEDEIEWPTSEVQQSIFVTTRAVADFASPRIASPDGVVGHSLGDFAALVQARAMDFELAMSLVDVRGRAMARAGTQAPGAMYAVLGLSPATVEAVCEQIPGVWPANFNSPMQTVVSGTVEGCSVASNAMLDAGAQRVIRLPIAIACHSPLMAPAADELRTALHQARLRPPRLAFYSAVYGEVVSTVRAIRDSLIEAVTAPVRFQQTVIRMRSNGFDEFVEIGPGAVLRALLRKCLEGSRVSSLSSDADVCALRSHAERARA